jgi:hypothetical protein
MNDYQKPGAAKRQSAILLGTAQKFDLRGLWIFAEGRLIAFSFACAPFRRACERADASAPMPKFSCAWTPLPQNQA